MPTVAGKNNAKVSSKNSASPIIKVMERWGEWCRSDRRDYRRELSVPTPWIGRAQSYTHGVKCPTCDGDGWSLFPDKNKNMRRVICPQCRGACKILFKPIEKPGTRRCEFCDTDTAGRATGEVNGRTCWRCRGTGRAEHQTASDKIVPAFIRADGARHDPDTISPIVDRLVCALPGIQYEIVLEEYKYGGRREDKCRRVNVTRATSLTVEDYQSLLDSSLSMIEKGLNGKI